MQYFILIFKSFHCAGAVHLHAHRYMFVFIYIYL